MAEAGGGIGELVAFVEDYGGGRGIYPQISQIDADFQTTDGLWGLGSGGRFGIEHLFSRLTDFFWESRVDG